MYTVLLYVIGVYFGAVNTFDWFYFLGIVQWMLYPDRDVCVAQQFVIVRL